MEATDELPRRPTIEVRPLWSDLMGMTGKLGFEPVSSRQAIGAADEALIGPPVRFRAALADRWVPSSIYCFSDLHSNLRDTEAAVSDKS